MEIAPFSCDFTRMKLEELLEYKVKLRVKNGGDTVVVMDNGNLHGGSVFGERSVSFQDLIGIRA